MIKKYPFVKQRGIKDCGPACVQMILKYYHGYVNMDKLSEMMNTNQNGTTAYHINETLKLLGFKSYGIKSSDILTLKLPCIAHVILNGSYKHYIVIYKVNPKRKTLIIADPATTLRKMSFEEFTKIWSGVTIQMYPEKQIVCESEPKVMKFLLYYVKKNLKHIVYIYFLSIIIGLFSLVSSLALPVMINTLNNKAVFEKAVIVFMLIFLLKSLFIFIKNKIFIKFNQELDRQLSLDIFKNILNLPYRYYRRKTTGEITSYFNDIYIIRNAINQFINIVFIEIPLIIILIIIIFSINIPILIITLTGILMLTLITFFYRPKQRVWISETTRNKALNTSYIVESIMGFETIKNLNITPKIYNRFKNKYHKFIICNQKLSIYEQTQDFVKVVFEIFIIFLIILTIVKYYHNNLTYFITLYILSNLLISSIKNILNCDYQTSELKVALSNIVELTNKKSENKQFIKTDGDIVIKHLNYTFDKINYTLKNINLIIPKASKVMVTGDSGSGKSTLFKIIKGYYKDYEGSVKIGNYEISKHNFSNILYVSQKEILFTGTLDDNLSLKKKNIYSAKICEIDEFAKGNYYQLIEEDGFNLSGGQKQRIVLARALNNFQILIIDEGLNQVSVDMERRILKRILKKYSDKTIIYISHRLDNLDLFEKYVKIQNGKVVLDTKRNN